MLYSYDNICFFALYAPRYLEVFRIQQHFLDTPRNFLDKLWVGRHRPQQMPCHTHKAAGGTRQHLIRRFFFCLYAEHHLPIRHFLNLDSYHCTLLLYALCLSFFSSAALWQLFSLRQYRRSCAFSARSISSPRP